jgi:hypothetical protein
VEYCDGGCTTDATKAPEHSGRPWGEFVGTVSANSVAVDGQQSLDEGLRLVIAKVVEVISK